MNNSVTRTSNYTTENDTTSMYFVKKGNQLTTYVLDINSYSIEQPYFLKLIITQNTNETEKFGYIKYIPTTPILFLNLATFSGEVQLLNANLEIKAKSNYLNGLKVEENKNNTQQRLDCYNEIFIIEVTCSHRGEHGVGESCNEGYINDAYYEIYTLLKCENDDSESDPRHIIDLNPASTGGGNLISSVVSNYINNLTPQQMTVVFNNPSIIQYLIDNQIEVPDGRDNGLTGGSLTKTIIDPEALEFIEELINRSVETGLTFDVEKSLKSPAFIDFSEIDKTTPEGQKLDCIYKKLTNSPEFKRLFEGTFGGDQQNLNIKFKMQANLVNSNGNVDRGKTVPVDAPAGSNGIYHEIIINSDHLAGPNATSNIYIAKTIIHELIHAYLNVRYRSIGNGVSLTFLSNLELEELLFHVFYDPNPIQIGINQHNFMSDHMIPEFQTILSEIINDLLSAQDLVNLNNGTIIDSNGIIIENFNFQHFYTSLAYEGLHHTNAYLNNIANNSIESTKHNQYLFYANGLSQECQ